MSFFLDSIKPKKLVYTPESVVSDNESSDDEDFSTFDVPNAKIENLQKKFDSFHLNLSSEQKEMALKKSAFLKSTLGWDEEKTLKVAAKTILEEGSSTGFTRLSKYETNSEISVAVKNDSVYLHHRNLVGQGNFKKALKGARISPNGKPQDVMRLKALKNSKEKNNIKKTEEEAILQKSLDHPNIVKVFDYNKYKNKNDEEQIEIYMEVCDTNFEKANLNVQETLQVMIDIASALDYLHGKGLVHNDLKDDNIFISGNRGKLGDFGKCREIGKSCGRFKATLPPEFANDPNKGPSTPQVDVYQFGLMLKSRFEGNEGPMQKLIDDCLQKDPQKRPSMKDVHSQLTEILNQQNGLNKTVNS